MTEDDFDGSAVLEKLAELGLTDEFFEAADNDDVIKVTAILRKADIDEETIMFVIKNFDH